jgi:hypothetical protein
VSKRWHTKRLFYILPHYLLASLPDLLIRLHKMDLSLKFGDKRMNIAWRTQNFIFPAHKPCSHWGFRICDGAVLFHETWPFIILVRARVWKI